MVQEQTHGQARSQSAHRLVMQDRGRVELTGVTEVVSFDKKEIILETVEGVLHFEGDELHVKRVTLERGEVDLEGRICGIRNQTGKKRREALSAVFSADGDDSRPAPVFRSFVFVGRCSDVRL